MELWKSLNGKKESTELCTGDVVEELSYFGIGDDGVKEDVELAFQIQQIEEAAESASKTFEIAYDNSRCNFINRIYKPWLATCPQHGDGGIINDPGFKQLTWAFAETRRHDTTNKTKNFILHLNLVTKTEWI